MTPAAKIVRYLVGGLLIGAFWYLNRGRPVWEEALRTIVVFSVLMTALRFRLRRRSVDVRLVPLIATKAALVVIAAAVEHALRLQAVGHAALIVAAGLAGAVFLAGALGDSFFFRPLPARSAEQHLDAGRRP